MRDQSPLMTKSWRLKLISLFWVEYPSRGNKVCSWFMSLYLIWAQGRLSLSPILLYVCIYMYTYIYTYIHVYLEVQVFTTRFTFSLQWGKRRLSLKFHDLTDLVSWCTVRAVWPCHSQLWVPSWKPGSFMPHSVLHSLNFQILDCILSHELQEW